MIYEGTLYGMKRRYMKAYTYMYGVSVMMYEVQYVCIYMYVELRPASPTPKVILLLQIQYPPPPPHDFVVVPYYLID